MIGRARGRHATPSRGPARTARLAVAALTTLATALVATPPAGATSSGGGGNAVLDYNQCANGTSHATACDRGWINGIDNQNNSSYREGEVVPQRALFQIGSTTSTQTHTLTLRYDTLKGSVHAFDSLATWNATETTADRCQGLASCPSTGPSTAPIPDDPTVVQPLGAGSNGSAVTTTHMLPAAQRSMVLYGGTIVGISAPTHSASGGGDASAQTTITFTAPASAKNQTLLLLYGGHLANSLDWGTGEGASSISGGPYHNSVVELDGASIGSRDNQVMNAAGPVPPAAYTVTKAADRATVNAGEQIGFTITVTSTGGSPVTGVTTDDLLPTGAGLSWTEAPDASACSISSGHLRCSFGDLAPGASRSVHIVSGTSYDSPGTITNTVDATSSNAGSKSATATITVQKASLTLTKTADAATVPAGSQIGFTIKVTNGGPGTAFGVTLQDSLPSGAGLSWTLASGSGCTLTGSSQQELSCSYASLASGASQTVHVTSTTSYATPSPVTNYVYLCATNFPKLSAHDSVTLTAPQPSLSLKKTADAASVDAGQAIGFTITLTNSGPGTAKNAVIDDPLPGASGVLWSVSKSGCAITGTAPQRLHCDVGDLGVGSFSVHVGSATTAATSGTLSNTATAKADNAGQVCASASITVKQPKVTLTKKADNAVVTAGDTAGWTVTIVNNGSGTASGLALSDPLPSGVTWALDQPTLCTLVGLQVSCPVGDLAPGKSFSVHVSGTTTSATGSSLYNKASLTGSNIVPLSADSTITVLKPVLVTTKTADAVSVSSGDPVGFTITTTNTGNGDARGVVISDPLPGGLTWTVDAPASSCSIASSTLTCNVGTLMPGKSFTRHVSALTAITDSGRLSNTATTTSTNAPTSEGKAYVDVLKPSVTLAKTADADVVDAGGQIGFVISLSNAGPGTAKMVSVTDALPAGGGVVWSLASPVSGCAVSGGTLTCTRATLGSGESITAHVVSGTGPLSCGAYPNTATASAANVSQQKSSATTTVRCLPVLKVTKTPTCPGQSSVPPGGLMSYTLSFSNTGYGTASAAVLTDTPDPTTQVTTAPGGTVTHNPEKVTWNLGALTPGASGTRVVVVKVGTSTGSITNNVTLTDAAATAPPASLTTVVSDTGADTRGSAYAIDLHGLPVLPGIPPLVPPVDPNRTELGSTSSQAPGTPHDGSTSLLPPLTVTGLADVKLLAQTSHSSTSDATARTQATSTTGAVNLLGGAVTATAVRAVSTSSATALTAGSDFLGSTITDLVVNGNPVATVPGTSVDVTDPTGTVTIARLDILTVTPPNAALAAGAWSSSQEVTALTLTLLKTLSPALPSGVVLKIAEAKSSATYPSGLVCGSTPASVEGEAFTVFARGTLSGVDLTTARQGDVVLPATGGASPANTVGGVGLGTVLVNSTGSTVTSGGLDPSPHATSSAHIENLSLLGGQVSAKALDVIASSVADGTVAGTSFAFTFTDLKVGATTIGIPVTPNTVFALPQADGSVLYVVVDEQSTSTTAATDTSGTVNAIHAYVFKSGVLTAEVIVSSAHSGAHTDHLT